MPLTKKIILWVVTITVLLCSFSGCIFDELFGGTSFSSSSWSIYDDEGFAGLNITFSCSGTVTVKLIGPDSLLLDSDFFFKGSHNAILHLAESRNTATPGLYKLRVYDNDNKEIYSESFLFLGPALSITSCEQKWWERDIGLGDKSLLGLRMRVENSGDTLVYPYDVKVTMDSEEITGHILPSVVMPGDSEYIDCFVYSETKPSDGSTFTVEIIDISEITLATGSFSVNSENNVPIKTFSWQYNGNHRFNIPKPEYLYDYYTSLDRISNEDYGLYVFDPYDNQYIDILLDIIMFGFSSSSDVEIINYVASFVQKSLKYESDSDTNSSFEYPRYPVETLFYGKGDCEDKAILTASLLYNLGYDVALLRLPNHMAVGVHLNESAIPNYDYFIDNYYFLETTTGGKPCGFIPSEYVGSSSDVTVYPISSRSLLSHNWKGDSLTIYTNTEMGDFVKVVLIVENLGIETAENVNVIGGFYKISGLTANSESETISSLDPGMKKKVTLTVDIPKNVETWFKTRIYFEYEIVDEKESISSFPT